MVVSGWVKRAVLFTWLDWTQAITKNTAHPFCIRQYATFQDKYHLYFLFDLMPGGDLMDVLVAEAKVITAAGAQRILAGGLPGPTGETQLTQGLSVENRTCVS